MRRDKTWVEIDKRALTHNVRVFRRHIGTKTKLMAVVKSNAYGHGLVQTAKIASKAGADWYGVDNVDEALELRKNGITKPILVLGYTLNSRLSDCINKGIAFVVYNFETVKALKDLHIKKGKKALVHIKIETGTNRQGVSGESLTLLAKELKKTPGVIIEGAYTHFANIEDTTDHSYASRQLRRFKHALETLRQEGIEPMVKHAACSAAAVLFPETYFDMVRLGISMYGLWSSKETIVSAKRSHRTMVLKPVLSWKSSVAQMKKVKKGSSVSYGLTEKVTRDSVLAVVPVGYWDGYDRKLSGIGQVLIHGHRCKIVGRICMNMCVVDATDVKRLNIEDEVVLLGKQGKEEVSAEEISSKIGTINYEVVTRINPLIKRFVH